MTLFLNTKGEKLLLSDHTSTKFGAGSTSTMISAVRCGFATLTCIINLTSLPGMNNNRHDLECRKLFRA